MFKWYLIIYIYSSYNTTIGSLSAKVSIFGKFSQCINNSILVVRSSLEIARAILDASNTSSSYYLLNFVSYTNNKKKIIWIIFNHSFTFCFTDTIILSFWFLYTLSWSHFKLYINIYIFIFLNCVNINQFFIILIF